MTILPADRRIHGWAVEATVGSPCALTAMVVLGWQAPTDARLGAIWYPVTQVVAYADDHGDARWMHDALVAAWSPVDTNGRHLWIGPRLDPLITYAAERVVDWPAHRADVIADRLRAVIDAELGDVTT